MFGLQNRGQSASSSMQRPPFHLRNTTPQLEGSGLVPQMWIHDARRSGAHKQAAPGTSQVTRSKVKQNVNLDSFAVFFAAWGQQQPHL